MNYILIVQSQIPGIGSKQTQVLLFSATFPEEVMPFSKKFCPNAVELRLQKNELNIKGISQMYIDCPEGEGKYDVLVKLYGLMNIGSSIIFVKVSHSSSLLITSKTYALVGT